MGQILSGILETIADVSFACFSLFCRDEHHSVSGFGTIDGGTGGIFQNFHRRDVFGIYATDIRHAHTIYHI